MNSAGAIRKPIPRRDNSIRASGAERTFQAVNLLFMFLIALVTLYPLLHVLFASFSNAAQVMKNKGFVVQA